MMLVRSVSMTQHRQLSTTNTNKKQIRFSTWDSRERQRQMAQRKRPKILSTITKPNQYVPLQLTSANEDIDEKEEEEDEEKKEETMFKGILPNPNNDSQRVRIRVRNHVYETWEATLETFPTTLLGRRSERSRYYDEVSGEYVFDRCHFSFDAILFYYQSCGILAKPANVKRKNFIDELSFFEIDLPLDEREEKEKRYEEKEVKRHHTLPDSKTKELIWRKIFFKNDSLHHNASYFIYCFILFLSVISTTFEPTYAHGILWLVVEACLGTVYTLEYLLRIYIAADTRLYLLSTMGIIDLISMATTQTYVITHLCNTPSTSLIKFTLVFRILKCTRVCRGIYELANVLWVCKEYIALFVGTAISCCIATAALIQHEEGEQHNESRPHGFDYFTWLWYTIITVTGVGYGDYYPHTTTGKIMGGFLSVCGMLLFCMAATQMVYRFVDVYYMPDVLGYTSKGRKREMIAAIRDEFLQDAEETKGGC